MSTKPNLLVVDDEPSIRRILQVAFDKAGYNTFIAEDAHMALKMAAQENIQLVLTDVTMPGMNGYELLRELRGNKPNLPVVIMTAYGTIPQAVQAIRDGAFEYVTKPFDLDALKRIVANALADTTPAKKSKPSGASAKLSDEEPFLAFSPQMKEVAGLVRQVADTRATVMIGGESGSGKEIVARALHKLSGRAKKPFVAVSCAAIPESLMEAELFGHEKGAFTGAQAAKVGRFEAAHNGTLFLDEIGEVPMSIQVKLLRVLQEREFERLGASKPTKVDVRLITATNRNLNEMVEAGTFRLDLLYRLQVVEIVVPPLRERPEDILPLARLFLGRFAEDNGQEPLSIDEVAEQRLLAYRWPGNVRELENTMERATVLAPSGEKVLSPRLLPASVGQAA